MKTRKYIVKMKEVWIQEVEIEAENAEEAVDLVADGQGDFVGLAPGEKIPERVGFEFQCTNDKEDWEVVEA